MSRRKKDNQILTTDAFSNPMYRLGFGSQNPIENTEYPLTRLTDNYALLNSMYRSGSILQSVVDIVPGDMLREWFDISGSIDPDKKDDLARVMRKTKLRQRLDEGLRWGRLYGGAVGIILIKGQENRLDKPLNLKSVMPDSFAGLLILDRWSGVFPDMGIVSDMSDPDFGLPEYYTINSGENGSVVARVHHSRVVRFTGRELPYLEKLAETYWGESEIEPVFTDIRLYDNVMANMGGLTFRANVDTMYVKNLEQLFAIGSTEQQKRFWNMMQAQSVAQSNFGWRLMDQENKAENSQYAFTGWNYVIEAVQVNLSGATHIPATKLFGRSPAGMNATGESDLKNYYDFIDGLRESKLRPILEKLVPVICMSALGDVPEDFDITFPPLWTPTASEVAGIAQSKSQSILGAFQVGALTLGQAQKELKTLADETGMFDSITDEDIEKNMDTTVMDLTQMQDPMAGLFGGGDEENSEGPEAGQAEGESEPGAGGAANAEARTVKGADEDIPFSFVSDKSGWYNPDHANRVRLGNIEEAKIKHSKYGFCFFGPDDTSYKVKGFQGKATRDRHIKEHMASVGAKSEREYINMAVDFMSAPLSETQEEMRLDYGVRMRYDYATGRLGAVGGDANVKTFFVPDKPIQYWERMVGMHGKRSKH